MVLFPNTDDLASKDGDLRGIRRVERVIERDSEEMVAEPELRDRVPLASDVIGRWPMLVGDDRRRHSGACAESPAKRVGEEGSGI